MCKKIVIGCFVLGMLLIQVRAFSQVRVTGHVSAEIVQGVSAASNTTNMVKLQQNSTPDHMNLGEISVSGGSSSTCAVLVSSSKLQSISGNLFDFEAETHTTNLTPVFSDQGQKVFKLQGSVDNEIFSKQENNYNAQYNVVFAYN